MAALVPEIMDTFSIVFIFSVEENEDEGSASHQSASKLLPHYMSSYSMFFSNHLIFKQKSKNVLHNAAQKLPNNAFKFIKHGCN
jgi:hypothetical protein